MHTPTDIGSTTPSTQLCGRRDILQTDRERLPDRQIRTNCLRTHFGRIIRFFTGGSPTRPMSSPSGSVAGAVALCGLAVAVIGAPHCSN
eukprot:351106-Chlamydomonas_euryale.AAC.1